MLPNLGLFIIMQWRRLPIAQIESMPHRNVPVINKWTRFKTSLSALPASGICLFCLMSTDGRVHKNCAASDKHWNLTIDLCRLSIVPMCQGLFIFPICHRVTVLHLNCQDLSFGHLSSEDLVYTVHK